MKQSHFLTGRFKVDWRDAGREPRCAPNPEYPNGIDRDCSGGASQTCSATLPYPARRCGSYFVECEICGIRVAVTTAGRPDDPRSVRIACREMVRQ
jgi:hypothetical protein